MRIENFCSKYESSTSYRTAICSTILSPVPTYLAIETWQSYWHLYWCLAFLNTPAWDWALHSHRWSQVAAFLAFHFWVGLWHVWVLNLLIKSWCCFARKCSVWTNRLRQKVTKDILSSGVMPGHPWFLPLTSWSHKGILYREALLNWRED